jgi:hypothetical protein
MNTPSVAAKTYMRLLLRLHALDPKGDQPDTTETDAIRDQMDRPFCAMTDIERELLGELSAALYELAEGKLKG